MHYTLWHNKTLLYLQINGSVFEVNNEMSFENEEELVVVIVFMPVILALHHTQSNDGIINFAKGLVVPAILALTHKRRNVDQAECRKQDV